MIKLGKKGKTEAKTEKEKLDERREEVLARGRKFKYPLQYAKHKLVFNTIIIAFVAFVAIIVFGWAMLYKIQDTGDIIYRLTRVLPVSVANVSGEEVRFSDYLMIYRSSLGVVADQQVSNWDADVFEFGLHSVFELETACAFSEVDTFVVRQVDSDGFRGSIAVASVIDDVIDVEVAFGTWDFLFVFRIAGELFLESGKHLDELSQVVAPFLVLDKDESLVGRFVAEESILIVLDRTDNEVEFAFLHIHPSHIGSEIVVGLESLAAFGKVFFQASIFGEIDSLTEELVNLSELFLVSLAIRDDLEGAVFVAADNGVLAFLFRVLESLEFSLGHIGRIEVGTFGFFAHARDEAFFFTEAVPSAILQHSESLHGRVREGVESGTVVEAVGLFPEEFVHNFSDLDKDGDELFFFSATTSF